MVGNGNAVMIGARARGDTGVASSGRQHEATLKVSARGPSPRPGAFAIVGNSEPRTRSMQDGPGQQCLLVFQGSAHAVVRLVAYAPRALRAPFAAGEQRMGTLLRTLPRPLRVGRDQHPLPRGPRDPG